MTRRKECLRRGAAVLLAAMVCTTAGAGTPTPVDGLWALDVTATDVSMRLGAKSCEEQLLIEEGVMTAERFSLMGFAPVLSSELASGPYTFSAVMGADKFGSLKWTGSQNGNVLTGTLTWVKADGEEWNYTFRAIKLSEE